VKKYFIFLVPLAWLGCRLPEEKEETRAVSKTDTTVMQTVQSYEASRDRLPESEVPLPRKIKNPAGIYQTILPFEGNMVQTVAFYPNNTYQLQEKYTRNKKDSVVVITGNWAPSDGYIWLYKDQLVRGRYSWKGDTLRYFSPYFKKSFTMRALKDAAGSTAWSHKKKAGAVFFGTGNEPFWSVDIDNRDSIHFLLSEWARPLVLKSLSTNSGDSTVYTAQNDSAQIKLTIYPYFCNNGMSDFVFRNRIKLQYNNQVYTGCGFMF
jgi:uncharacterized membrane protein